MRKWAIAAIAVIVVAIAAGAAWAAMTSRAPPAPSTSAPSAPIEYAVALTDPPEVPYGTTAILLNYSGVAVHTTEGTWYSNASASGTINLMALQNLSVVIANVRIPANATVNVVRLYISNATIVINGTSYPLLLPSGELTIPIINASRAQGALVDLQPRVTIAYVGDQPVYIMAPAAVAVPLNYTAPPGHAFAVPKHVRDELERFRANLVITSASISVNGNVTTITITVRNEGNETVEIYGVRVHGPWSINVPPITVSSKDFTARIIVEGARANMTMVFFVNGTQLVPALRLAAPHLKVGWPLPPGAHSRKVEIYWSGNASEFNGMMGRWGRDLGKESWNNLTISGPSASGSWSWGSGPFGSPPWGQGPPGQQGRGQPGDPRDAYEAPHIRGYELQPGQSVTFTFEGTLGLGPRFEGYGSINITVVPVAGGEYLIYVMSAPSSNATAIAIAG